MSEIKHLDRGEAVLVSPSRSSINSRTSGGAGRINKEKVFAPFFRGRQIGSKFQHALDGCLGDWARRVFRPISAPPAPTFLVIFNLIASQKAPERSQQRQILRG